MMKKENSNVRRQLAALLMIPAAAIGLSVLSIPAVASLTEEIRDAELIFPRHAEVAGKVSEKIPNEKMQGEIRPQAARTASTPLSLNRPSAITGQEKEAESCPAAETSAVSDDEGTAQIPAEETKKGVPRYEVDGMLMAADYDMSGINSSDIKSMTIVKNDPDFPDGLIKIELLKRGNAPKTDSNKGLLVAFNSIDNVNGTHLVFQFLTDEEIHLKDVIWTIDGKDHKPESVSSSFSKSGEKGFQVVKIDLPATIKKFKYGQDKISFTRDNGERESFVIPLEAAMP